jgi:lysophospholipase L1-like esterase
MGTSLTANYDWPKVVKQHLRECFGPDIDIHNFGEAGATSRQGYARIGEVVTFNPHIVFIEFLINDADLRRRVSLSESWSNHQEIVEILRRGQPETAIVFMISNRAYGLRRLLRPRLPRYETQYEEIAFELSVGLIDLRTDWHEVISAKGRGVVLPDGLHPNANMARDVVASRVVPYIAAALWADCRF